MYVYMWKEPRLDAIKIGYGNNPNSRMLDYAHTYKLECEPSSLVKVEVPEGFDCAVIEKACHDYAIEIGLLDITPNGVMQELFLLKGESYQSVAEELKTVIEDTLHNIVSSYSGGTPRRTRRDAPAAMTNEPPPSEKRSPYPSLKPGYRWANPLEGWEQEPDTYPSLKPGYRWVDQRLGWEQEPDTYPSLKPGYRWVDQRLGWEQEPDIEDPKKT